MTRNTMTVITMTAVDTESGRCAENVCATVDALARKGLLFDCPVCHSNRFCLISYTLHDGRRLMSSFYRCGECDFGFTHPEMFAKPLRQAG